MIAAYRMAREEVPGLRLALVGSMALDDPEAWDIYRQVAAASAEDPLIHLFTNLTGVGNIEVNAFQRLSNVIVQKSVREGFGLVVSEALWKETPVVAGRAGGIPLQMADGAGGFLVESTEECAQQIVALLKDGARARELARRGKERVRDHFLLPRLLLNEVTLMADLVASRPLTRPADRFDERDPVCGMSVARQPSTPSTTFEDRAYVFCSAACRARFLDSPRRYAVAAIRSS